MSLSVFSDSAIVCKCGYTVKSSNLTFLSMVRNSSLSCKYAVSSN